MPATVPRAEFAGGLSLLLEPHVSDVREVFLAARHLVLDTLGDAVELIDLPRHAVAYALVPHDEREPRMRHITVALLPRAARVDIQLADGSVLDDRHGILEGTVGRLRRVGCRTLDDVRRPELRALLEAERARRRRTGRPARDVQAVAHGIEAR